MNLRCLIRALALVAVLFVMAGCNAIGGLGRDIQSAASRGQAALDDTMNRESASNDTDEPSMARQPEIYRW